MCRISFIAKLLCCCNREEPYVKINVLSHKTETKLNDQIAIPVSSHDDTDNPKLGASAKMYSVEN